MSLLDDGRDVVILTPEIVSTDSVGNPGVRIPDPDPEHQFSIGGRMQPSSSSETDANGQRVQTFWTFRCRDFPAGAWAVITWNGTDYDVEGEPVRHNGSDFTKHVTVPLKARSPQAVS